MLRLALITSIAPACITLFACSTTHLPPGILLETRRPADVSPANRRPISPDGLKLTKKFEGFSSMLYNDDAGFCTIAYGHLVERFACNGSEAPNFLRGITREEGSALLDDDMGLAEDAVVRLVTTTELTGPQFSALCDFVFNVGSSKFATSTLRRVVERSSWRDVPTEMRRWVIVAGKHNDGLKRRREAEIKLFFTGNAIPMRRPGDIVSPAPIDILVGEPSS